MPRDDTAALLKRLLAKEITDATDNEVLDEVVALTERLPLSDSPTVTETASFRWELDEGQLNFCELADQLAGISTSGEWAACTGTRVVL